MHVLHADCDAASRQRGERLGKGERVEDVIGSMKMVAEGYWNSSVVNEIAARQGIEMPICNIVYALCHEDFDAKDAVSSIMGRGLKPE